MIELIEKLNAPTKAERLDALKQLMAKIHSGEIPRPVSGTDVNNHIHTIYSFSPYSPTKALWMAYNAGLSTAGIMDHDSISGAAEFVEAGEIIGMATTVGIECRVDVSGTPLVGRRVNNPDQKSVAYMAIHGIPHTQFDKVKSFLAPFVAARNIRNRKMVAKIDAIVKPYGLTLDFDRDVAPLSMTADAGSITERHILFGLSKKITEKYAKGAGVVSFLEDKLSIGLSGNVREFLLDSNNPYYEYDLLGALKSDMVSQFYIDADDECPYIRALVAFAKEIGGISAYAYLGDVGNSVTGDKKTQKFEDDYLDLLFDTLSDIGFSAVTYMPSRNTMEQLTRVKALCDAKGFFQISGEDINTPRQKFICEAQRAPEFANLFKSTWALIGHEIATTARLSDNMFSDETIAKMPSMDERIDHYAKIGQGQYA